MKGELKPCPVCNKQPIRNGRTGVGGVLCSSIDPVSHRLQIYGANQDAADEAWNTRASHTNPAIREAVGRTERWVAEAEGFGRPNVVVQTKDLRAILALLTPMDEEAREVLAFTMASRGCKPENVEAVRHACNGHIVKVSADLAVAAIQAGRSRTDAVDGWTGRPRDLASRALSKSPRDEAEAPEASADAITAYERLLRSVLAAIDTGRSEPLFIVRDLLRNFLADKESIPVTETGGE